VYGMLSRISNPNVVVLHLLMANERRISLYYQ
jgi:hypothetical protein